MLKMKLVGIDGNGTTVQLVEGVNRVGRMEGNEVVVADPSVSGSHCELVVEEDSIRLLDKGATNGTFVNDERVEERVVFQDEVIRFGDVSFRLDTGIRVTVEVEEVLDEMPLEEQEPAVEAVALEATKSPGIRLSNKPEPAPATPAALATGGSETVSGNEPPGLSLTRRAEPPNPPTGTKTEAPGEEYLRAYIRKEPDAKTNFMAEIGPAFSYPLKGDGLLKIFLMTLFTSAVLSTPLGFVKGLAILAIGYSFSFLVSILNSTGVCHENDIPDFPDFTSWWDDAIVPAFQVFLIHGVTYGPAAAFLIFGSEHEFLFDDEAALPGLMDLVVTGLLFLMGLAVQPMCYLLVGILDTVMSLNPIAIFVSIWRVLGHYSVCLIVLALANLAVIVGNIFVANIIPIPFLPGFISDLVFFYMMMVQMRLLGMLYQVNKKRLGWH